MASFWFLKTSRAAKRGGFPIWTCPCFFVLSCPFWDFPDFSWIFPICSEIVRGFSRFVLFLFLGLLTAPTRNSPERVCDTIWTFPEKVRNPAVWETPRFSFSHFWFLKATHFGARLFCYPFGCLFCSTRRGTQNGWGIKMASFLRFENLMFWHLFILVHVWVPKQ